MHARTHIHNFSAQCHSKLHNIIEFSLREGLWDKGHCSHERSGLMMAHCWHCGAPRWSWFMCKRGFLLFLNTRNVFHVTAVNYVFCLRQRQPPPHYTATYCCSWTLSSIEILISALKLMFLSTCCSFGRRILGTSVKVLDCRLSKCGWWMFTVRSRGFGVCLSQGLIIS